jgi:hypothetical protein
MIKLLLHRASRVKTRGGGCQLVACTSLCRKPVARGGGWVTRHVDCAALLNAHLLSGAANAIE